MIKSLIFRALVTILLLNLTIPGFCEKDFAREFKVIRVPPDRMITIDLEANPTTGFSWQLTKLSDKTVLQFVKKEYVASSENLIGSGGVEKWSFKTLKPGKAVILLEYRRAWEKDIPAAKKVEYTVFVK